MTAIRFQDVSVTYPGAAAPALAGVDFTVAEGELLLVVGPTGSGKSTLLGAMNGLVPHFTGGTLSGRVVVADRDTAHHPPRELADVVGMVVQDPMAGFVTDCVEEELAYSMESLGVAPQTMRRRVEETLDLLGLAEVRDRPMRTLSGGQRQRVAIGSVLTAHPSILVLDEPTSALDPGAAEEVLATLQRLVHDLGITVVVAEHRLERVVGYADRVAVLGGPGRPFVVGDPQTIMSRSPIVPPVVSLARTAGWQPVPLTVRQARRRAAPLREQLAARTPAVRPLPVPVRPVAQVRNASLRYGRTIALQGVSLSLQPGTVTALMGRNGAGKSTLLGLLAGALRPAAGTVEVDGADPLQLTGRALVSRVALVPQDAADLLVAETVAAECAIGDRDAAAVPGTTAALLDGLVPGIDRQEHPRDLSEGQRLTLALAVVMAGGPALLLLDEPTRGLDYAAKDALSRMLLDLRAAGTAVVLATHDVELAAEVADRVVVLAEGQVVADGPGGEVLVGSPVFAPQVAKIIGEGGWLTVAQVAQAVGA
jgi:energy-coupling factor transport system ATP-binding protein